MEQDRLVITLQEGDRAALEGLARGWGGISLAAAARLAVRRAAAMEGLGGGLGEAVGAVGGGCEEEIELGGGVVKG